jgi:hypothetical protein
MMKIGVDGSLITSEELLEQILILVTVNSTLIEALITIEAGGALEQKQIKQLTDGVRAVKDSVTQAIAQCAEADSDTSSSFVNNAVQVILKHLDQIEKALVKLAKSSPVLAWASDAAEASSVTVKGGGQESASDLTGLTGKPFQRRLSVSDPDKRLPPIQQLLDKYSSNSHLLLPTYWYEACKELFRYSEPEEIITLVTRISGEVFYNLIRSLLSEAPGSRLLQELFRKSGAISLLTSEEHRQIIRNIQDFYNRLAKSFHAKSITGVISEAKRVFKSFDWGPATVEKRVVGLFHRSAKELLEKSTKTETSRQQRIVYAELCRLVCDLTAAVYKLPRIFEILVQMKD